MFMNNKTNFNAIVVQINPAVLCMHIILISIANPFIENHTTTYSISGV